MPTMTPLRNGTVWPQSILLILILGLSDRPVIGQESIRDFANSCLKRQKTDGPNDESTIDAIVEIRRRLGGGITSHLGEIVPLNDADRMFREEIEHIEINHPTPIRNHEVSEAKVAGKANIAAIRQVAKQLDELACQLEDFGRYESADALRSEAQKIRMSMR